MLSNLGTPRFCYHGGMAHQVIYVPGLGDRRPRGQTIVLSFWKLFGLKVHYFPLGWADKEDFQPKLTRLLAEIDELSGDGGLVSLVGVSAGASAVLNAYALRKDLNAVVCVCGKIQNPQTIGGRTYQINPAFKQSAYRVKAGLNKLKPTQIKRILSIHPRSDSTVPINDTKISGATEKTAPVPGHIFGIFYSITFGLPTIARFIKAQEPKTKKNYK